MFTSLAKSPQFSAPSTAPTLDWNTFQQTFAPVLYSGDPRQALAARGQWANQLGWDLGGKGNVAIEGLDRDAVFGKYVPAYSQGYGDNAGSEASAAWDAAYANPQAQAEWRAAVDAALADPNTVYRVTGDRLVEQDGTPATGQRSARQVQYKVQNGQLVPIGQNDYERSSGWKDFREQGLPGLLAVGLGGYGLETLLGAGAGAGAAADPLAAYLTTGGAEGSLASSGFMGAVPASGSLLPAGASPAGYFPANAAGALGGVGAPTSTAGFQFGQMAGALPGAGGAAGASVADPLAAYLTTGGAEGSILGSGVTGAGGAAGAVGAGTAANFLGNASNLLGGATKFLGGGSGNMLNLGGNLLNSYLGYRASGKAADAQIGAAREANALQKYMYDQSRADYAPWRETGTWALGQSRNLLENPSQISADPSYQFELGEGMKAYDNSGAARGMRLSGAQAKALTRYGQDFAGTQLDRRLNRYNALSGSGLTATGATSQAGQNYANQAGQNITGAGNAAASGYIGGANAIAGGVNNFLRNWQEQNLLRQFGFGG